MRSGDWLLVNDKDEEVQAGIILSGRDDDMYRLQGGRPPHKPSSSGRVFVTTENGAEREFFPHVFDLKWVKEIPISK